MIAYRRFIPRDFELGQAAKAAQPAKGEASQGVQAANTTLKPANAESFSRTLAEPSQRKSAGISHLSGFSRSSRTAAAPDPAVAEPMVAVPPGWVDGVERLLAMSPPLGYPPTAWHRVVLDAEQFMDRWAAQAAALGWRDWEVWGIHGRAPWHRLDGRGLVPALQGDKIGALTETEALVISPSGARFTLRRRPHPLHAKERVLLWELEKR